MNLQDRILELITPELKRLESEMKKSISLCMDSKIERVLAKRLESHIEELSESIQDHLNNIDLSKMLSDEEINDIIRYSDFTPSHYAIEEMIDMTSGRGFNVLKSDSIVTDMKIEAFAEHIREHPYNLNQPLLFT